MEVLGRIKHIYEIKEYGSNGFRKRELVLTTEEQYPQHLLLEFVQDKCDLLNSFSENDRVKVGINLRGREWQSPQGETKFFNSIQGWRIESLEQSGTPEPPPPPFDPHENSNTEALDDLPF
ncbi:MAG: DUF3127 domain-containing protein [Bacteroidota bacterium]|nr:DUF3127 domain-containing protein [Bacteroidota bacterium]